MASENAIDQHFIVRILFVHVSILVDVELVLLLVLKTFNMPELSRRSVAEIDYLELFCFRHLLQK